MSLAKRLGLHWSPALLLRMTLFCVPLVDEFVSGIPVLTMPLIQEELRLGYTQVAWLFALAELTALLVDPAINAISDHRSKRWLVLGGMFGLAVGFALAGSSSTFGYLLLGFVVIGAANGSAVGLAEAALIDQEPGASLRVMTRWTLMGAIGDILAPVLVTAAIAYQTGWRVLLWSGTILWLGGALLLLPQRFSRPGLTTEDGHSDKLSWRAIRTNLVTAWRTPTLPRWLMLDILISLLDEIFLVFAALFLKDKVGLAPAVISGALGLSIVGGLCGLVLLDRLSQRFNPRRLLGGMALVVLIGLVCLITTQTLWQALIGLWLVGLGASGWYPIVQGAAYAALPGRSGALRTLQSLGAPVKIGLPLLIGWVAETWGIQAGMAVLGLAPILALFLRPR